ncbi:ATP-grasp domain-containing protein [Candidatus Atribacteria bacterium 1244-E10-H5-B2]|jgi:D-alanine-D-alanine ligase-like ATP-grasp enzyme|nr:MAG: ATP-grasp domain-containing protein [Candidatus Atribacteria bacterium 1244-E10-H5-B2]
MIKNILFVYNQVSQRERKGLFRECIPIEDVDAIRKALVITNNNILSLDLLTPEQLDEFISKHQPIDLAFVLAEGYKDIPHTFYSGHGAAMVRQQFNKYHIPCALSSIESMEICRNKDLTYIELKEKNIPIPGYFVFDTHLRFNKIKLLSQIEKIGFPLMIKPVGGGDSIGITPKSLVHNLQELKNRFIGLKKELGPEKLIIEKYLPGREYTVGVLGSIAKKYILPIIAFPKDHGIRYTSTKKKEYKMREKFEIIYRDDERFKRLAQIAINTFDAVRASDAIRIDFMEDELGNIYVIDVNGTPALSPSGSLAFMSSKVGLTHSQLIKLIFYESIVRYNLAPTYLLEDIISKIQAKLATYYADKDDKDAETALI